MKQAYEAGLKVSITTQGDTHFGKSSGEIEEKFRNIMAVYNVKLQDVKILPNLPQGNHRDTSVNQKPITSEEFERAGTCPETLMCHTSRTLVKYDHSVKVFPCTILIPPNQRLIPDFEKYNMGNSLKESFSKLQPLDHPSCRVYCVQGKQTCANTSQ